MKKIRLSFALSLCLMSFASCTVESRIKSKTPDEIDPNEYVQTVETYQITFLNGDGSRMYNAKMNKGESLTKISNSLIPTLASDGDNDFIFKSWEPVPNIVEADTIFRPVFEKKEHTEFTFQYSSSKEGYILQSYNLQSRELISVPSTNDGYPVVEIAPGAFANKTKLKTVNLGENIVTIGEGAFENCSSLNKVTYYSNDSTSLTTIGNSAFAGCRKLKMFIPNSIPESEEITLPASVTTINNSAFEGCTEINNILLGENVSYVGEQVFKNCPNISSIIVNEENKNFSSEDSNIILNLTTKQVVAGCKLSSFTSTKIEGIANNVFEGVTLVYPNPVDPSIYNTVTDLVLHDKIVSIGEYAFAKNSSFTSVTLQGKIKKIYQSSFEGCSAITSFKITGASEDFFTSSNCIIRKKVSDGTTLPTGLTTPFLLYGTAGVNQLDPTITGIGPRAFYGSDVETIVFNTTTETNKITYLGDEAFRGCTKLKTLRMYFPSISNDSASLPLNLCRGCTSLTEIVIPLCFGTMTLGDQDTKGNGSFYDCPSLHTVCIPNSLQVIHENTFTNCRSISTIIFSGTEASFLERLTSGNYKRNGNEYLFNCPNKEFGNFEPFRIPTNNNNNT